MVGRCCALIRSLITGKEKEFVLDDRAAQDAAKLVTLQLISFESERIPRIENAITNEFEEIPVEIIRARLRHRVDSAGRVLTVLGRHCAGLDFEFLQGVRKGQGQIQVVKRIIVRASVQKVRQTVIQSAGNGDGLRRVVSVRRLSASADSCT